MYSGTEQRDFPGNRTAEQAAADQPNLSAAQPGPAIDLLQKLRWVNARRSKEAFSMNVQDFSPTFWGCATAGEVGEMCNKLRKLEERGIASKEEIADIAEEAADVVIYLDLLATRLGFDLRQSIINKFNATSAKKNVAIFL